MLTERYYLLDMGQSGQFRLVPEVELSRLLEVTQLAKIIRVPAPEGLTFGFLVRLFRAAKGVTGADLATNIRISRRQVINIESDIDLPCTETLSSLFEYLGTEFQREVESLKLEFPKRRRTQKKVPSQ